MAPQYIFQMQRLTKAYGPEKPILNDVSLSFLSGAKIGVLGYNGAGKSTLLKIMAGIDTDFRSGEAMLAPGATVGMLEQEPQLDETKTARENVLDGVAEVKALLDRFNELAMNYSDETADEFAALTARLDGGAAPPAWPEPDGRVKTSAAWLIERAGFHRGDGDPAGIAISSKHVLALTNRGAGTTAQLVALARRIAAGVWAAFGVALHPEPVFVGHAWDDESWRLS